ncbi:MAG: type II toxin-antitoxin system VapC family toxin [Planctomycetales bacterium]
MALYVLDTDIFSLLLNGDRQVCERAVATPRAELAVTIVTVEESLTGWYAQVRRARKVEAVIRAFSALQRFVEQLGRTRILSFDMAAAAMAQTLRSNDRRVGTNDLRIAAIVLCHSGVLVTRNTSDFSRFTDLIIEDWSLPEPQASR